MDRYDSVSPGVEKDNDVYRNGAVNVERRGMGVLHSNTTSQHRGLGSGRISSRETDCFVKEGSNLCNNDTECGVLRRKSIERIKI